MRAGVGPRPPRLKAEAEKTRAHAKKLELELEQLSGRGTQRGRSWVIHSDRSLSF